MTFASMDLLRLPTNQAYPISAVYQGLVYPGEVVSADRWEPGWGSLLQGNFFFRIVFLKSYHMVSPPELDDQLVAFLRELLGRR